LLRYYILQIFVFRMMRFLVYICILSAAFCSCADKYEVYKTHYQFTSNDGRPAYNDLKYWAAHPLKWDPSDSIPAPLQQQVKDSTADVFFIHPTTHTKRKQKKIRNAFIDDDYINAKTDYTAILYQASVFNGQCRVFAPRYRQAHIKTFFSKDKITAEQAFAIAYQDVKTAFEYYLQHWNNKRPFIIAAHSQGGMLAKKLLKEYFDVPTNNQNGESYKAPLASILVAAYIIGWSIKKEDFIYLKMCSDSLQTGCICSWRTLKKGFVPWFLKNEKGNSLVTNPLTWKTDTVHAPRSLNTGSVLMRFNKIYKHTTDAQIRNGFLYVRRPKFPWSFLYTSKNYHPGDINLYYMNIRSNVKQRIEAFLSK
jgi:hypothetical protein